MDISVLAELKNKIAQTWQLLKLEETRQTIFDLSAQTQDPQFWQNTILAKKVTQQLSDLQKELATWEKIKQEVDETLELSNLVSKDNDLSLEQEVTKKTVELKERFEKLEFYVLFSEDFDQNDAIVSVHAGAGGVDAQDWAEMLVRMITRFSEQQKWSIDVLDKSAGQEAGIKSITLHIHGRYAYGYLQSENGVHRLVRISPFDAEAMRHTSFALVEVIPELPETVEIEISDSDLKVDVYRSSGPGGQSVNTTDSAVRMTHLPSGITVSCQNERSQHQNRETALKILKSKLHKLQIEEKEKEELKLKGEAQKAEWGKQIRSYVMQPYKMVKDHRTNHETQDIDGVLNGNLESFMEEYLRWIRK